MRDDDPVFDETEPPSKSKSRQQKAAFRYLLNEMYKLYESVPEEADLHSMMVTVKFIKSDGVAFEVSNGVFADRDYPELSNQSEDYLLTLIREI